MLRIIKLPWRIPSSSAPNPLTTRRPASSISTPLSRASLKSLLSKPSWSVKSLQDEPSTSFAPTEPITQKQLHHLLRLSALPLPESPEEEAKMIETLQAQLHFVRAIQSVDTTGVKPLCAIRDESREGRKASEHTLESMQEELEKEEVVGFARRIRRKADVPLEETIEADSVDPLKLAPETRGRYVVVNTKKS